MPTPHEVYLQGRADGYEAGKNDGMSTAAMNISRFFRRVARPVVHPVEPAYTTQCPTCNKQMTAPTYVFQALKRARDMSHRAEMVAAIGAAMHNHPYDFGAVSNQGKS